MLVHEMRMALLRRCRPKRSVEAMGTQQLRPGILETGFRQVETPSESAPDPASTPPCTARSAPSVQLRRQKEPHYLLAQMPEVPSSYLSFLFLCMYIMFKLFFNRCVEDINRIFTYLHDGGTSTSPVSACHCSSRDCSWFFTDLISLLRSSASWLTRSCGSASRS